MNEAERYATAVPYIERAINYARSSFASHVDEEELHDEAHNAFMYVLKSWRPDGGASFYTLLRKCMNGRFRNISRRRARQIRLGKSTARSIRALHFTDEMRSVVPAPSNVAAEHDMVERLEGRISDEALLLARRLMGDVMTRSEIAVVSRFTAEKKESLIAEIRPLLKQPRMVTLVSA